MLTVFSDNVIMVSINFWGFVLCRYQNHKREQQENITQKKYDRIELKVPKGEKDLLKIHAEKHGESLNSFINRAIKNQMKADNGE